MPDGQSSGTLGDFIKKNPVVIAAGIVIVGFVLPWIQFGGLISFTGFQMARAIRGLGNLAAEFDESAGGTGFIVFVIYMVPAAAAGIIVLAWLGKDTRVLSVISAIIPPIMLIFLLQEAGQEAFNFLGGGYYLSFAGGILAALLAFNLIDVSKIIGASSAGGETGDSADTVDDQSSGTQPAVSGEGTTAGTQPADATSASETTENSETSPQKKKWIGVGAAAAVVLAVVIAVAGGQANGEIEGFYQPATEADSFIIEYGSDFVLEIVKLDDDRMGVFRLPVLDAGVIPVRDSWVYRFFEPEILFVRQNGEWIDADRRGYTLDPSGESILVEREGTLIADGSPVKLEPFEPDSTIESFVTGWYSPVEDSETLRSMLKEYGGYGDDETFVLGIFDFFPELPDDVDVAEVEEHNLTPDQLGPIHAGFLTARAEEMHNGNFRIHEEYSNPDWVLETPSDIALHGYKPSYEARASLESEEDFDPLTGYRGPYTYPGGTFPADNVEIQIRWFDPINETLNTKFHVFDGNPSADGSGGYMMVPRTDSFVVEFDRIGFENVEFPEDAD